MADTLEGMQLMWQPINHIENFRPRGRGLALGPMFHSDAVGAARLEREAGSPALRPFTCVGWRQASAACRPAPFPCGVAPSIGRMPPPGTVPTLGGAKHLPTSLTAPLPVCPVAP
jgi:hypothetical protein